MARTHIPSSSMVGSIAASVGLALRRLVAAGCGRRDAPPRAWARCLCDVMGMRYGENVNKRSSDSTARTCNTPVYTCSTCKFSLAWICPHRRMSTSERASQQRAMRYVSHRESNSAAKNAMLTTPNRLLLKTVPSGWALPGHEGPCYSALQPGTTGLHGLGKKYRA